MAITPRGLVELTSRALLHGATRIDGANAFEWDVGAFCDAPINRTLSTRGLKNTEMRKHKWTTSPGSLSLHLTGLPCRKCEKCRYIKRSHWTDRILAEMASNERNWFVTLTLNPSEQHRVFMEEIAYRNSSGWLDSDFDKSASEWRLRCDGVSKLLTKYLKRVRKPLAGEDHIDMRYIAMFEPHENGLPHLHLIMHERAGSLTYDRICERWLRHGFADASLVKNPRRAGEYVAKYITKYEQTRVRASQKYGLSPGIERMEEITWNIEALIGLADQSERS